MTGFQYDDEEETPSKSKGKKLQARPESITVTADMLIPDYELHGDDFLGNINDPDDFFSLSQRHSQPSASLGPHSSLGGGSVAGSGGTASASYQARREDITLSDRGSGAVGQETLLIAGPWL